MTNHLPPTPLGNPLPIRTSTSSSATMYSRQSSRLMMMGGLSTKVASLVALHGRKRQEDRQPHLSQQVQFWITHHDRRRCHATEEHEHPLCAQCGLSQAQKHSMPRKHCRAPADVGRGLALAGVDSEVARALVDADHLPRVDVYARRDHQPSAVLNAAQQHISPHQRAIMWTCKQHVEVRAAAGNWVHGTAAFMSCVTDMRVRRRGACVRCFWWAMTNLVRA